MKAREKRVAGQAEGQVWEGVDGHGKPRFIRLTKVDLCSCWYQPCWPLQEYHRPRKMSRVGLASRYTLVG